MGIERVGVVGRGIMGSGIAQVCARAGTHVTVYESDPSRADAARQRVGRSLARAVRSGKLSPSAGDEATDRLSYTSELAGPADRELVLEAIVEDEQAKLDV